MKFKVIEGVCLRGNAVQEDFLGTGENYLFAIDGASMLTPEHVTPAGSDAAWLSHRLGALLHDMLDTDMSLREILTAAAETLRREYDGYYGGGAAEYPSAGVGILRLRDGTVEYIGLGDITAMVETAAGVDVIKEELLSALDGGVIAHMEKLRRETGCTMRKARELVSDELLYNRRLLNHPEGYWIFDPTGVGVSCARERSWPREEVLSVSLVSDGFYQLCDTFSVARSGEELMAMMKSRGVGPLCRQLRTMQEADRDMEAYPRFKTMDDTTAVLAEIE